MADKRRRRQTRHKTVTTPTIDPWQLPPGINPEHIGNAQIDDAYLASEESGAAVRSREIVLEERRARVIGLRRTGATYRAIADQLGVSPQTAHNDYTAALKRLNPIEDIEEARQLEIDRMDRLQLGLWETAAAGDIPSVLAILRISDRRCKLLGLDQQTIRIFNDPALMTSAQTIEQEMRTLLEEMDRRDAWNNTP